LKFGFGSQRATSPRSKRRTASRCSPKAPAPKRTGTPSPATSIFFQVRNGAVHILDYKPDARTNKPIAQLTVYALALTRLVPGLKLFDIKCAWFNEEEYCEFFPRTLLARQRERTAA